MDDTLYLQDELSGIRQRIRLVLARKWAVRGGLVAGAACIALILASRLLPEWEASESYLLLVVSAGLVGGAFWGFTQPLDLMQVARWAEGRLGLKDRLSTAVELGEEGREPVGRAVAEDAAERLRHASTSGLYPRAADRPAKALAALLVVCVGLYFVPDMAFIRSPEKRAAVANMRNEGEKLEQTAKDLEKKAGEKRLPTEKQIAANMKSLGRDLRKGRIGQKEALLRLNKLTKEIQARQKTVAGITSGASNRSDAKGNASPETAGDKLDQAGVKADAGDSLSSSFEESLSIPPDVADQLSKMAASLKAEDFKALKETGGILSDLAEHLAMKNYREASQLMSKLSEKLRDGKVSEAEMKELARKMEELAKLMEQSGMKGLSQEMKQSAKALAEGNAEEAAKGADQAAEILTQLDMLESMLAAAGQ